MGWKIVFNPVSTQDKVFFVFIFRLIKKISTLKYFRKNLHSNEKYLTLETISLGTYRYSSRCYAGDQLYLQTSKFSWFQLRFQHKEQPRKMLKRKNTITKFLEYKLRVRQAMIFLISLNFTEIVVNSEKFNWML